MSCGQLGPDVVPLITRSHHTRQWPWHAAIYYRKDKNEPRYVCGGTLIKPSLILTAAHCVSTNNIELDEDRFTVYLGRLNLAANESSSQVFKANAIFVHPNFSSIDYVHDIAIIRLSTFATLNNYVQPICLWNSDETDLSEVIGKTGTVVGWGRSTETGPHSDVIQVAYMPVVTWVTCLKSNTDVFGRLLSDTNYCAGFQNGTSVCQGDSGGSMTFEINDAYYIRGIVSISPSKMNEDNQIVVCDSSQYAVFTDVAKYLPWIDNVVSRVAFADFFMLLNYLREHNQTVTTS